MKPDLGAQLRNLRLGAWVWIALFALSAALSGSFIAAFTAMGIVSVVMYVAMIVWSYVYEQRSAERGPE